MIFEGAFTVTPDVTLRQLREFQDFVGSTRVKFSICHWALTHEGLCIPHEGKCYEWEMWLGRVVKEFLKPQKLKINGKVQWFGDEDADRGIIYAKNNKFEVVPDEVTITNPGPSWAK